MMSVYTIQAGDCLWNICKTNYDLTSNAEIAAKVKEIAAANNIANPGLIFAGNTLNLGVIEDKGLVVERQIEVQQPEAQQQPEAVQEQPVQNDTAAALRQELEETKSKQSWIGKAWDGFKNLTGLGAGSNKAQKAIEQLEKGEITEEEAHKKLSGYQDGQKICVDVAADIVSGIAAVGAFSAGVALAPVTGGASVAIGLAAATTVGAGIKTAIKAGDAVATGKEYTGKDLVYDLATGAVNGILAPVTNGIGASLTKTIGTKLGLTVAKEAAETVVEQGVKRGALQTVATVLKTQSVDVVGGNIGRRALALGAGRAVDGAISGAGDNMMRAALNGENVLEAGLQGAVGGLVLAPVIGGGFRVAAKGPGRILRNFRAAAKSFDNVQVSTNSDSALMRNSIDWVRNLRNTVDNTKISVDEIFDVVYRNTDEFLDSTVRTADSLGDFKFTHKLAAFNESLTNASAKLQVDIDRIYAVADEGVNIAGDFTKTSVYRKLNASISDAPRVVTDADLPFTTRVLRRRFRAIKNSDLFRRLSKEQQTQVILENSNITFAKFAQTMSSDPKLPPDVQKFLKQFTSNAAPSRNLTQAQDLANELYSGNYTIKKACGVGTIGETYLATDKNGMEVIIKMLKENITPEKIVQDRRMMTNSINAAIEAPAEKQYYLAMINGMFDAWTKETDFGNEFVNAQRLANGAKNFNVARTLELGSKNGRNISLVMEKADGIGLDSLIDMIDFKKANPMDFLTKSVIENGKETNPWLKNIDFVNSHLQLAQSDEWMKGIGSAYRTAQNEQLMFLSQGGTRTLHADPHGGNVFIDFDAAGKPKLTFIDTGNVVVRTNAEVMGSIALSTNLLIGNSEGISKAFLEGATLPSGAVRADVERQFAGMLDEHLFKAGVNLKEADFVNAKINSIMQELKIVPNPEVANLAKASLQRTKLLTEIVQKTGVPLSSSGNLVDLTKALINAFQKEPAQVLNTMVPVMRWAVSNSDQAMQTFFQMIMKQDAGFRNMVIRMEPEIAKALLNGAASKGAASGAYYLN